MDSILVELATNEMYLTSQVGTRRQLEAMRRKLKDKAGFAGDGWNEHIEGASAELAFSKWSGMYWDAAVDTFSRPDFPPDIDVKVRPYSIDSTNLDMFELNIRPGAEPDYRYIHVVGIQGRYLIRGWAWGRDAMVDSNFRKLDKNRDPSFVLYNRDLRPMAELEIPEHRPIERTP